MPRYNVEADGDWACFSSVTDSFITPFIPLDAYEEWRRAEYGKTYAPIKYANVYTLRQALFDLSLNRSDAEIIECLREAGLIYDNEEENE